MRRKSAWFLELGLSLLKLEKLKVAMVYISNRLERLKDSTIRALGPQ